MGQQRRHSRSPVDAFVNGSRRKETKPKARKGRPRNRVGIGALNWMGSRESPWKYSFQSPPSQSSATTTVAKAAPSEFLCPISRSLMADPVVVAATGWTFERSSIEACVDLGLAPPDLVLIPNTILKSAILNLCDSCGLPPPLPVLPEAARALVSGLIASNTPPPSDSAAASCFLPGGLAYRDEKAPLFGASSMSTESKYVEEVALQTQSIKLDDDLNESSSSSQSSCSSSSLYHTFSASSAEIAIHDQLEAGSFRFSNIAPPAISEIGASEEEILTKLMSSNIKEQEFAAVILRNATRDSRDSRIKLCSPRLLSALRSMILSGNAPVQINAVASVVNISLEPENKAPVVRSGAVIPLVDVLKRGHPEAREHAAAAFFSFSMEDDNRVTIGALGTIPPLLSLFAYSSTVSTRARRDAGKALYYLSLAGPNRVKIAQTAGAVHAILSVVTAGTVPILARLAIMVVSNLAACGEGRSALMDAEAVAEVVRLMRDGATELKEHCLTALYGMSRDQLRFPGLAKEAGAERVLMEVADGEGGDIRRKMAKKTLRAMRREKERSVAAAAALDFSADCDGNAFSDGLMSFRGGNRVAGNGSDNISAPF